MPSIFENIRLDKTSATPLYEQLRQSLSAAITGGELSGGEKLPTENELCTELGISRPVARQAYAALLENGYVERARGRGTFVHKTDGGGRFMNMQISFVREMRLLGAEPHTELVRREHIPYNEEIYHHLQLSPGDGCYHILRKRYANGKLLLLGENYIPETIFPDIGSYDLGVRSLYEIYSTVYHLNVLHARRVIVAQLATAELCTLLGVARGGPVLRMDNLAYDQYERPVDWSREYYNGLEHNLEFEVQNK